MNLQRSTNPVRVAAGAFGRCREGIDEDLPPAAGPAHAAGSRAAQLVAPDRVLRSSWRVGRWSVTMIQHLEVKSSNGVLTIDNEHALSAKNHIPDPTD